MAAAVAGVDEAAVVVVGVAAAAAGRSRAGNAAQIPKSQSRTNPKAFKGVLGFFLAERARLSGRVYRLDMYAVA